MKSGFRRSIQIVYSIYAILTFLAIMLVIFPLVIMSSFLGKIKGGNIIMWLCRRWADIWFPLIGIFFYRKYLSPRPDPANPSIYICNHISYLDAAVIMKAFRFPVRPLGKYELGKLPLFGLIYRNCVVSVDRSSVQKRAKSLVNLKSVLKKGISVLVFPEGTFNTTPNPLKSFYDGAFRLAIETQTEIRPVLFLDTYKRMHYSGIFTFTPGKCRIVYLPPVQVKGRNMSDLPAIKKEVYDVMEQHLRIENAAWIS